MSGHAEPRRPVVTVVGSFAVGLTLRADRFPVAGETVVGRDFDRGPGGKGSNQAVQAARLGADVEFVGLVGDDDLAAMAWELYRREGVGTRYLGVVPGRNTGVGFIVLNAQGENFIVLDPGANGCLGPAHVERARERLAQSHVVLTQLEIPVEAAVHALRLARDAGVTAILNPAPARPLPLEHLALADVITPNETELRILLGLPPDDPADSLDLCHRLLAAGVRTVVLTRGARGVLVVEPGGVVEIPAFPVAVVDTTGAGDAFSATFAVSLAEGRPLAEAARRAAAAGALACTALGVIPALPRRDQLDALLAARA
ncbi:ribokinase [Thermaerobacter marianensis DSM 12885]|uniref:Ribokinase n=1 Tax=Thermaerobacter marianensis (strain ATCC 700841 / DSM 12885 / JCM 10246 / 7p75a) TaxID=644966 RepID=E6SM37_THEM7|nr:ribokinase [Thermaerobacter marianensis]ADU50367.1 ribokinase [Thermaerobacter marianensis DSM 12885]